MSAFRRHPSLILLGAGLPLLAACGQAGTPTGASTVTVTVTAGHQGSDSRAPSAAPTTAKGVPAATDSAPSTAAAHPPTARPMTTRQASVRPKAPRPAITAYQASETRIACSAGGPGVDPKLNFDITFSWSTAHATQVFLGVDTTDAVHNSYSGAMPAQGSVTIGYGCYDPHRYTLAAVGSDGRVVQETITLRNVGDPGA